MQALSTLRHLDRLASDLIDTEHGQEYQKANLAFRQLYLGVENPQTKRLKEMGRTWEKLLFSDQEPTDSQSRRIHRLARKVRERKEIALQDLGQGSESDWLLERGIPDASAVGFWQKYLKRLSQRDITTFTNEQKGPEPGFDTWLHPNHDLLVVLPTGSGKTVIGELKTALALAQGQHVIWILPTRALVRQARRELRGAFEKLKVTIEELPTTEDFLPLFTKEAKQTRYIAATTPEKLAALMRSNPTAINKVGLVVLDEAQILTKETRGTTVEFVLQQIRRQVPACSFVLMTAFQDIRGSLEQFLLHLSGHPSNLNQLTSDIRPTRRIYGIITSDASPNPVVAIYPPGIQDENATTTNPYILRPTKVKVPAGAKELEIARRFVRAVTSTKALSENKLTVL